MIAVIGRREAEEGKLALRRLGSDGQEILELGEAANLLAIQAQAPDVARQAAVAGIASVSLAGEGQTG